MTKAALKPCQCGNEAKYAAKIGKLVFVDCTKCGMGGPEDAWNNRPTEQALVDALKMWKARIVGPTDHTMQDVLIATDQALEMAGVAE